MTALKKLLAWPKSIYYKPTTGDSTVAKTISITAQATATVGDIIAIGATVKDEVGQPVSSASVVFSFASAAVVTDPSGYASALYTATDSGAQVVTATVDSVVATATVQVSQLVLAETAPIQVVDLPEVATEVVPVTTTAETTAGATTTGTTENGALAEFKAKAEAFFSLVEHGVEVLGKDAEADLVALRSKYL